jgi:hypothetical protein
MEAKIQVVRQEQDQRYRDVDVKLDRNSTDVRTLERTLSVELGKIRELLAEAKDELAENKGIEKYKQWIIPTLVSLVLVIIEALHLFK